MTQTARTDSTDAPSGRPTPPPLVRLIGMSAGLGAILVVLLALFILPSLESGPRDLPVGLVGDSAASSRVEEALETAAPGAYDVARFDTAEQLAEAVRDREVVGGLVVSPGALEAVVASAGSSAISGALSGAAEAVGAATGSEVRVTDVVPLPDEDPTGLGIGGLAFPLVFGGIVPVVAFGSLFPRSNRWRLAGLTVFAGVGGLLVAGVLRFWFGSIETGFWPVAGAMALGIAALALPLAGLKQLLGAKGFTVGAMTMMFLGNPLAGMATTGAWLPAGLGTVGQLLPPGAAGALVRSAAYFGGAGALVPALTLLTWVVVGLVLYAVGSRRHPLRAA
ncbi:ABC transporter permease [Nocardioides sp. dk4132]|uniref:ABC transporter permease n=1 Tax=unclassified Nocardioides TaxID=2615069 RepID=UPI001295EA78|nr:MULTISPECIES: ABC transporter permease [unclassified Nocardioides]MQW75719.1 ABC transporter permease [Nocardioides sp. dk4132]QGA08606.1 ABC transporter permease [Nocardioides sp. dk884]